MGIAVEGFKVVTEFVFNADQALGVADSLNKQVDKLSRAADSAVNSITRMGISYAMTFSGASGGILGVLANGIKASDKFKATQIELSSVMIANGMRANGGMMTFNEALTQSGFIMDKLVAKARKLGISPDQLIGQTKAFNAFLAPKGLAGDGLSQASELARVSLKAAPALGISDFQAMSGIQSGISGDLSSNTQFGKRLFLESGKEIEAATGIKSLKEFNKAIPVKRIQALIVGLDKLAGTADVVKARADTLGSRLIQIRDLFVGIGSILKPLGDVILPVLKEILDVAITFLKKEGAEVVKQLAIFLKGFMAGPKEMMLNLMQLRDLSGDFGTAISIGGLALAMAHTQEIVGFLASTKMTRGLGTFLQGIGGMISRIPLIGPLLKNMMGSFTKMFSLNLSGGFLVGLKSVGFAMLRMAGLVGILLIPLQGLSRAINRIKLENMFDFAKILPEIGEFINSVKISLQAFMAPFQDMIVGFGNLFYEIIRMLPFMGRGTDGLVGAMRFVADGIRNLAIGFTALWGSLKGIIAGMAAVAATMASGKFTGLGAEFGEAFTSEFTKAMDKVMTPTLGPNGDAEKLVNNNITQNIKMNNNFKEVLQPDRIAFTIQKQLEKAANNRTGIGRDSLFSKLSPGI